MIKRFVYAQLNANGVVIAKSDLATEVNQQDLIAIPSMDACLLGDTYSGGVFVTPPTEEGA